MYNELVKALRETDFGDVCVLCESELCRGKDCVIIQAADAIEHLIEECDVYRKAMTDEHNRAAKIAWEKEHCWIPVTERLPEDGSDILAVQSYCGEVRIIPANYDRGVWYDCVFNRVAEHITHWMPLPPAPKEEN